jgi:hypothetical protein
MGEGVNIVQRPPKMSFSTRRTSRLAFSFFFLEALGMMNVVSVYRDKFLNQQSFALMALLSRTFASTNLRALRFSYM